jgi:hypothetical protein
MRDAELNLIQAIMRKYAEMPTETRRRIHDYIGARLDTIPRIGTNSVPEAVERPEQNAFLQH